MVRLLERQAGKPVGSGTIQPHNVNGPERMNLHDPAIHSVHLHDLADLWFHVFPFWLWNFMPKNSKWPIEIIGILCLFLENLGVLRAVITYFPIPATVSSAPILQPYYSLASKFCWCVSEHSLEHDCTV